MKDNMKSRKIKVWYSYVNTPEDGPSHVFAMDRDCLFCEATFVTSFMTDNPARLSRLVEQYARQTKEFVSIELFGHERSYWQGKLDYESSTPTVHPLEDFVLEELCME